MLYIDSGLCIDRQQFYLFESQKYGGRVLIRAKVDKILVEHNCAVGVMLVDGTAIKCRKGVVSSAGYTNTVQFLLKQQVCHDDKLQSLV